MRLYRFILAVSLAMPLAGCFIDRAAEIREQVCAFDEHFELQFEEQPSLLLHDPVLRASDIEWLAMAPPFERRLHPGGLTMSWLIEQTGQAAASYRLDADFSTSNDAPELWRLRVDHQLEDLIRRDFLDDGVVEQATQKACEGGLTLLTRRVRFDLTQEQMATIPGREELVLLLGPPSRLLPQPDGLEYSYQVRGADESPVNARLRLWYDEQGERLMAFESEYGRYRASGTLLEGTFRVKVGF